MTDRNNYRPIEVLKTALAEPQNKHYNKKHVTKQSNLFLAVVAVAEGKSSLSKLATVTQKTLEQLGTPDWNQSAHEMFLVILLNSGFITLNRDMYPEINGT